MDESLSHLARRDFLVLGAATFPLGEFIGTAFAIADPTQERVGGNGDVVADANRRLVVLMDTLIPARETLPSASAGGVPQYIQKFFAMLSLNPVGFKDRTKKYADLLTELSKRGFFLPDANREDILKGIQADKNEITKALKLVQDDVFTGYFADSAIWHEGQKPVVWRELDIDPIFPIASRPDVRQRKMRAESRNRLVRHLHEPNDRLAEVIRSTPPETLVDRAFSARSPVY